jgi:hypothetical protein
MNDLATTPLAAAQAGGVDSATKQPDAANGGSPLLAIGNDGPAPAATNHETQPGVGTGTNRTSADESGMAGGLLGELRRDVERDLPACTCGKPPGQGGHHKKGCARRHDSRDRHFAAPVLSAPASALAAVPAVVQPQQPSSPADYSGYRELVCGWYEKRVEIRYEKRKGKWETVVSEKEAEERAEIWKMPKEKIERLGRIIERNAAYYKLPTLPPWVELSDFIIQEEIFGWLRAVREDKAIAKLLELKKQEKELKEAA